MAIASQNATLHSFSDPPALLAALHRPGDPDRKNRCLLALLHKAESEENDVATTLIILALWPGLDAVRGRLLRYYKGRTEHLDAELIGRLSIGIRRAGNVRRVAATLLRNVERDLRRDLMREAEIRKAHDDHAAETAHLAKHPEPVETGNDDLSERIERALGRDGALVVAVALQRLSQKEAAERLGLTHDAARKRYQRVMRGLATQTPGDAC